MAPAFMTRQVGPALALLMMAACGSDRPEGDGAAARIGSIDPCALVTAPEAAEIAGTPVKVGTKSVEKGTAVCAWSADDDAKLILVVSPATPGGVRDAVKPAAGYRVLDLEGLGGPAAASIQEAATGHVGMLAVEVDGATVRVVPVAKIANGSPAFDRLRGIVAAAVRRLREQSAG
jgi:hypothetical protein